MDMSRKGLYMKKKFIRVVAAFTAFVMTTASVPVTSRKKDANAADNVVISPFNAYEINDGVFQGWGTSLCWWANRVGYSDSLSEQAAELFFGDSGLRMNIARYNIGGGDDPSHDHITRTDSNMPGYTKIVNGQVVWDWDADYRQRNVLMKSIDACKDGLIVEMFSNSPPYYMCQSGCSTGNTNPGKNNLKDDCYDDFAEYFANVCDHFTNVWGVDIQSATPLNEPYTNYWGANSYKQEGCHFDIGNSESNMYVELDKAMKKHGLDDIILSASDETSIDTQIDAYKALSAEAKSAVGRIDTHTYGGWKRGELKDLALQNGMNLWMSEVDGGATAGKDNGQMGAALWLAERMSIDLNGLNPSAWILWQAIDKHICAAGFNGKKDSGMPDINTGFWGLAVADHDNDTIILTKKYYAFGQFSRFIRPGFTMLNASGNNVAAYDKENGQVVIVAVNTGGSGKDVNYDLSQFTRVGTSAQVIRTSGDVQSGENWKELTPIAVNGGRISTTLLANSVTTFIINDVDSAALDFTEIPLNESMVTGSDSWHSDSKTDCKKVVDGDLSTYFDGLGNGYVQVDLGAPYDLSAVAIAPRSGYAYRCVDAAISISADGTNWTEAYKLTNEPFNGLNYFTNLAESKGIRYVRYQTPAGAPTYSGNNEASCCCNLAEIKVYGEPAGMDNKIALTSDMVTGSAPWRDSVNDCKKVVDGRTDTYFDGVGNGWIQIDLGDTYAVNTIAYCPRSGYEFRSVDSVISGSVDGVNWTELYTINDLPTFRMNYVELSGAPVMRYIKYSVPEGAPQNSYNKDNVYCCNLAEIAVYGEKSAAPITTAATTTTTTTTLTTVITTTETKPAGILGDANEDGIVSTADAAAILQYLGNGEVYKLSDIGKANADVDGADGITPSDALTIQKLKAGLIDKLPAA